MWQYTRSQVIKLLNITGHQLDYLIKQTDIKPKKLGHAVIFTFEQVVNAKLALLLKSEFNYSYEIIKGLFEFLNENISVLNSLDDITIVYNKSTNIVDIFESNNVLNKVLTKKLLGLDNSNEIALVTNRFIKVLKLDKSCIVHIINKADLGILIDVLSEDITSDLEIKVKSVKPVLPMVYEELKMLSNKYNIPIPDVA